MARQLGAAGAAAVIATALSVGGCGRFPASQPMLSERDCMARVMYFESNRSSEDGMLAVGTVVMNRAQSPRYPKSVCGVVGQRNQFADGALSKPMSGRSRELAYRVADAVLSGERHEKVGSAMFFHTAGLTFPYRNMHYVVVAGGNAFYEKRRPGTFDPVVSTMIAEAKPAARPQPQPSRVAATRPAPEPVVLASLAAPRPRREKAPPTIADIIAMDLEKR